MGGEGVPEQSTFHFNSQDEKVILANLNLVIKPLFQKHRVN